MNTTPRTAKLSALTAADVAHLAAKPQGRNEMRTLLGIGGLFGRSVSAASEKLADAALEGLRDGYYRSGDASAYYTGEQLDMYRAALAVATRVS